MNDYAIGVVVPPDGERADCFRILTVGKASWQVENTDARVIVCIAKHSDAVLLDTNGMATPMPVGLSRAEGAAPSRWRRPARSWS